MVSIHGTKYMSAANTRQKRLGGSFSWTASSSSASGSPIFAHGGAACEEMRVTLVKV